jgi:hypothetical protein
MRFGFVLLAAATLAACGSPSEPGGQSSAVGIIVARDRSTSIGNPPTIHVKDGPDDECGVIYVVTPTTRIMRRTLSGRIQPAFVSELTVGRHVDVKSNGVFLSCPGQSWAEAVEIVDVK